MNDPKYYFGNYPNSANYDDNVPIGWNKWDEIEPIEEEQEDIETENDCDYDDKKQEEER